MKNEKYPDPNVIHPISGYDKENLCKTNDLVPILTCNNLSKVKAELEKRLDVESDEAYEDIHDPCLRFQR